MISLRNCVLLLALAATGCTTVATSNPSRTATEQMVISMAADQAASKLLMTMPANSKVFIDTSNFEGIDSKYAIGAIRTSLLQQGIKVADAKKDADIVIEVRSGALSTDNKQFLIGVPTFSVPVPFASTALTLPEIALYKSADQKGIAKFAATTYDAKSGLLIRTVEPQYGFSHNKSYTVLIFISWTHNDADPEETTVPAVADTKDTPPPSNIKKP